MKDETLFPCPFCGGEPEEEGGTFIEYRGHERQDYSITCKQCGAEVHCEVGDFEGADAVCSCHHNTRKICSAKWNRRALQSGNSSQPVTVPAGYVLVPVEPTTNQWAAGMQAFDSGMDKVTRVYKAMLAAAPTTPDGWIPVSERMPERGVEVLACKMNPFGGYDEIEAAQWHGGMRGEQPVFITSADTIEPELWQPLPEAPKVK